ncbi:uncharacterized protein LOC108599333 [Drosophila busckii]|uniref:uncharacterized protein LOC108599333 n=1 Tax=Drosophila busckii TaxID=30019 RepID=UPI00083E985B|nr:uncharacterized protein LOC108599333 [Drosophila busckii]
MPITRSKAKQQQQQTNEAAAESKKQAQPKPKPKAKAKPKKQLNIEQLTADTKKLSIEDASNAYVELEEVYETVSYETVKQFINSCSLNAELSFVNNIKATTQLLQSLSVAINELETVQLAQLLDLYNLAILMQSCERQQTHCMSQRLGLLQAVAQHAQDLQPLQLQWLAEELCSRLLLHNDVGRAMNMLNALKSLIQLDAANRQLATTIAFSMFARISGQAAALQPAAQAFALVQLLNWQQLLRNKRHADIFVLLHCFALITNLSAHRQLHADWTCGLGSDIHKFFMQLLRAMRSETLSNYNAFAMMLERFIAFCIVRLAKPRPINLGEDN